MDLPGGATLLREGEPADAMYLVLGGRLLALHQRDGDELPLREIVRGDTIGEMSLVDGGRRTATVRALRDARLLRIDHEHFAAALQRSPRLNRLVLQRLARKLGGPAAPPGLACVVLHPCAGASSDAPGLLRGLLQALAGRSSAAGLDRPEAERRLGAPLALAPAGAVTTLLDAQEDRHTLLLLLADADDTAWTRLCLRRADRVLRLVCPERGDLPPPQPTAADPAPGPREELVLLHPPGAATSGTAAWLAGGRFARHHHLACGDAPGLARLARRLTGQARGLALGGGGARSFAEIGVLQALEAHGVPIDTLAGTSMGAVIAALSAQGLAAREIRRTLHTALRHRPFSGWTLPLVSLFSGRRLAAMMDELFGERCLEDLPRPLLIACSNLTRGTLHLPSGGPLKRWLRASNAVPGLVPPVPVDGELYVDGALRAGVPVAPLRAHGAGPVFSVGVGDRTPLRTTLPDDALPSARRLLRRGSAAGMPTLPRILVRAMLMGPGSADTSVADLCFEPPLDGFDVADWDAMDALAERGYADAMRRLDVAARSADAGRLLG